MATVVAEEDGSETIYIKGAPEIVLAMCKHVSGDVSEKYINEQLAGYQQKAMRTLGFAVQKLPKGDPGIGDKAVTASDITFLGIVAIADP